jgi:hypothetical protein
MSWHQDHLPAITVARAELERKGARRRRTPLAALVGRHMRPVRTPGLFPPTDCALMGTQQSGVSNDRIHQELADLTDPLKDTDLPDYPPGLFPPTDCALMGTQQSGVGVGPRRNEQLPKRGANEYVHDWFRRAPALGAGACR